MTVEHKLYIGANNQTGEVEVDKAIEIVGRFFAGFTVQESIGIWHGKREKSIVVTVVANEHSWSDIDNCVRSLTEELHQDFVLRTSQMVSSNLGI